MRIDTQGNKYWQTVRIEYLLAGCGSPLKDFFGVVVAGPAGSWQAL